MKSDKQIIIWLFSCCAAIFLMVLVGGLTRLTDSGLSIMVWEPLKGALPPLSESQWEYYFAEYKKIPEFSQVNSGFGLREFKEIFWLEYIHRLLGRVIGALFFIPFVYFWLTKKINRKLIKKLSLIFALGGLQGFAGWYMVSSGFSARTDVSQYRLAIHLLFALVIYAAIFWTALDVKFPQRIAEKNLLIFYSRGLVGMVFFMIFLGALVAGTRAGLSQDNIIPSGLYSLSPWWLNHFENVSMVQFQHRLFAMFLMADIAFFGYILAKQRHDMKIWVAALVGVLLLQVILGIATLREFAGLSDYFEVKGFKRIFFKPVILAATHQLNAVVLLSVNLIILHKLLRKPILPAHEKVRRKITQRH